MKHRSRIELLDHRVPIDLGDARVDELSTEWTNPQPAIRLNHIRIRPRTQVIDHHYLRIRMPTLQLCREIAPHKARTTGHNKYGPVTIRRSRIGWAHGGGYSKTSKTGAHCGGLAGGSGGMTRD